MEADDADDKALVTWLETLDPSKRQTAGFTNTL